MLFSAVLCSLALFVFLFILCFFFSLSLSLFFFRCRCRRRRCCCCCNVFFHFPLATFLRHGPTERSSSPSAAAAAAAAVPPHLSPPPVSAIRPLRSWSQRRFLPYSGKQKKKKNEKKWRKKKRKSLPTIWRSGNTLRSIKVMKWKPFEVRFWEIIC